MADVKTAIESTPLDINDAIARVSSPSCGGIAVFVGVVRESAAVEDNTTKPVARLEYEAHPELAERRLAEIAEEATEKWDLRHVVAVHRVGTCELGEPTVIVACGAPHRGDALDACRWVIDSLKLTVPIWKREVYSDGSSWVGAEGDR